LFSELLNLGFRVKRKDVRTVVKEIENLALSDIKEKVINDFTPELFFEAESFRNYLRYISQNYGDLESISYYGFTRLRTVNDSFIEKNKTRLEGILEEYLISEEIKPQEKKYINYGLVMGLFDFFKNNIDKEKLFCLNI